MTEEIKNLTKSVDSIAQMTAKILETMATKKDLEDFKLETNIHFNNLETDLKSFKVEADESLSELNEKFDDLHDTVMNHDKRIEALEVKVLA